MNEDIIDTSYSKIFDRCYKLEGKEVKKCNNVDEILSTFDLKNRKIKQTVVSGKLVSTVFLVLDHNFSGKGDPILFESLVFPEAEIMERYRTYDQAIRGHEELVKKVEKELHG